MDKLCLDFKLMKESELLEFVTMLLIESKCNKEDKFYNYIERNTNVKVFNKRYRKLLDKFLNDYALNKTEKSD